MLTQKNDGIATMNGQPDQASQPVGMPKNAIDQKAITEAIATLKKYKAGKESLEKRIVENEQWYKLRHWEVMRSKYSTGDNSSKGRPEPSSAWLFNAIANKHADAMDNFPEPSILPREQSDEGDAKSLTSIIPVILERNEFEETYSDVWWYKLKMGTGALGVFWDPSLENGLGDITIKKLDLLKIYWEPGIVDIQKSRNLFLVDLVDNDILAAEYPQLEGKLDGKVIDIAEYVFDDTVDTKGKSVVVDWYYKRRVGTKTVLHYVKFVGNTMLFASENDPQLTGKGWYDHGKYPVEFDVLYPEEGTPIGFGYIDICKDPQMYIDKLNQIIMENTLQSGRKRYFVKDTASINVDEFLDWSKDIVSVSGSINDENIREIDVKQLDGNIVNFLTYKIEELKETSGNRDVNQGSTGGGVTAAAAIAALQEAGNKLSRDIIKGAYRSYTKINYLVIENIRQFYSLDRTFRIEGTDGAFQYIQYSNANIQPQMMAPAIPGMDPGSRVPVFDIKVKPQRSNPFNRMAHNELAKELYGQGFFNPQLADQALIALDMMDFEGKETIVEKVSQNGMMYNMVQQLLAAQAPPIPGQGGSTTGGKLANDGGIMAASDNARTSYGEKLADRAKVAVE